MPSSGKIKRNHLPNTGKLERVSLEEMTLRAPGRCSLRGPHRTVVSLISRSEVPCRHISGTCTEVTLLQAQFPSGHNMVSISGEQAFHLQSVVMEVKRQLSKLTAPYSYASRRLCSQQPQPFSTSDLSLLFKYLTIQSFLYF